MRKPKRRLSLKEAGEYTYWMRIAQKLRAFTGMSFAWDFLREETREMRRLRREWAREERAR